jgi:hypothetical protein
MFIFFIDLSLILQSKHLVIAKGQAVGGNRMVGVIRALALTRMIGVIRVSALTRIVGVICVLALTGIVGAILRIGFCWMIDNPVYDCRVTYLLQSVNKLYYRDIKGLSQCLQAIQSFILAIHTKQTNLA